MNKTNLIMKKVFYLCAAVFALAACTSKASLPLVDPAAFDTTIDGKAVALYTLSAGDITMQVTNFGGRVVTLFTPDKDGNMTDIVIGRDNIGAYAEPKGERFLGATVGPVANRIGKASFKIGDETFNTPANDNGVNTLHGGLLGVDMLVWDVEEVSVNSITLHLLHPDGLEGYPGNVDILMTYTLSDDNSFTVNYKATTDKTTHLNLSHHSFFNLEGEGGDSVEKYIMTINASKIVPIDELSIPTGELMDVEGTPFDFREAHAIGERIGADHPQIKNARGYDHNWCIDRTDDTSVIEACTVYDPDNGRYLEVLTDQPGIQFYSGNFFDGTDSGKNGKPLGFRSSLALETQHYPDTPNQSAFPSTLLNPGETYTHTCVYRFSVK